MTLPEPHPELQRHLGLTHAVALNVSQIVGAGVFATVPLMLKELPGPYAMLGWVGAGILMLLDGMVWAELGAAMPSSGGSYVYLLECYGRERWGRLMAFLFVWQFLISGPLEIASAFIAMAAFASALPGFQEFNAAHQWLHWQVWQGSDLGITIDPARLIVFGLGMFTVFLLYRRITTLGRLTVTVWLGVMGAIAWILVEGATHGSTATLFAPTSGATTTPQEFIGGLGRAMLLAMYSYLGYYNVCYLGDEVREPGKTIPRAIFLSAGLVMVLFVLVHAALLSVVPAASVPRTDAELNDYSLSAVFMKTIYGEQTQAGNVAVVLITVLLIWSCFGSAFAGLLGYSRIPYGAARQGHFFAALAKVHPIHRIPHVSLLFVGGLTLLWTFFDLQSVISMLLVTRILEQFLAQIVGVMLLRKLQPERPRPYRIWLYPLPCVLAFVGWVWLYLTSDWISIGVGLGTLTAGVGVYLFWSFGRGSAKPPSE